MPEIQVNDSSIESLIKKLHSGEWLIPQFQRDFVWSINDVISLINSIFDAKPIGMITLWQQKDDTSLVLEKISIPDQNNSKTTPDQNNSKKGTGLTYLGDPDSRTDRTFAILDGKQRSTALALVFGGLRARSGIYRHSGRYFLDVTAQDKIDRVKFLKESQVQGKGYDKDSICIADGLFPLSSNSEDETFDKMMLRYAQEIKDEKNYPDAKLPDESELKRRNTVLFDALEGIKNTKLAVYVVPAEYGLAEICDIFETLNTTGTKVSTVDLIHSWLFAETINDEKGPFLLRERIDDIGELDGAVGWSSTKDRPELLAQIVTACYISLRKKVPPRPMGGGTVSAITSVKSADLLATPKEHWKHTLMDNVDSFVELVDEFQRVVSGTRFPHLACPYPVSASLYVSLRWKKKFEPHETETWNITDLEVLFRAFFWRNALSSRYDQGFLTKLGSDINLLLDLLNDRRSFDSGNAWIQHCDAKLSREMLNLPDKSRLVDLLTDGRQAGALQRALMLPMRANAKQDFLDPKLSIDILEGSEVQMHHIYPKRWCSNNQTRKLANLLDRNAAGRDWVNSIANLMPMHRSTNNRWKAKNPGQVLVEEDLNFGTLSNLLKPVHIDEEGFNYLWEGEKYIKQFWEHRADLIANDLVARMTIKY